MPTCNCAPTILNSDNCRTAVVAFPIFLKKEKTKQNKTKETKTKIRYPFLELSFRENSCQNFWLRALKGVPNSRRNNKIARSSFVSGCLKALMQYSLSLSTGRRSC